MESVKLSRSTTVAQYRRFEAEKDRAKIVHFLRERFNDRYFRPLDSVQKPHGFFTMAISCLLIEAIQAFRNGWQGTTEKRKKPYRTFFRDLGITAATRPSNLLITSAREFSILGETYGGWHKIHRRGPMLDFEHRTVNADLFSEAVRGNLREILRTT